MPIHRTESRQFTEWIWEKSPNGFGKNHRTALNRQWVYDIIRAIMTKYRKRIVDDILALKLSAMGAVLVEGAKWCGKTTTCEQRAKSVLYMADPTDRAENLKLAEMNIGKRIYQDNRDALFCRSVDCRRRTWRRAWRYDERPAHVWILF